MKISYSKSSCFKTCKLKYFFDYKLRLEPKVKVWPLIDGEAMHLGLEKFYTPTSETDRKVGSSIPMTVLLNDCLRWGASIDDIEVLSVVDTFYSSYLTGDNTNKVEFHRHLVMGMLAGYCILYKDEEYDESHAEVEATKQFGDVELTAKADGLIREDDRWWIRECKTTSFSKTEQLLQRLLMDWQPTIYTYVFRDKYPNLRGVMYDIIKKPTLRQNVLESTEAFHNRLTKSLILDAKAGGPKYYARDYIYRSPDDLAEFEKSLRDVIKDIRYHELHNLWYPERERCFDFKGCKYLKVCQEANEEKREGLLKTEFKEKEK